MKRGYVDIPEGQVHYRYGGQGESLLLLHQTGQSSVEYEKMVPGLEANFRVFAMDTLGYGNSDKPATGFRQEDYARTVVEFLATLGVTRTAIVGHLTGAATALEVAAMHPALVSRMVLIDLPFYSAELRLARQADPGFQRLQMTPDGSYIMDYWRRFQGLTPGADLDTLHMAVMTVMQAGPRIHDGHQALFHYEMESRLPMVRCPVRLVSGTQAPLRQRIPAVREIRPDWDLTVIEGGGDMLPFEKPEECNRVIFEFVRAI